MAALSCTAAALFLVSGVEGVYETRVSLVFLPPTSATPDDNSLGTSPDSLVAFAGIVDREYRGNDPVPRFSSVDASMSGVGVRSGTRVFQPNAGGQWTTKFVEPALIVESVGPSEEETVKALNGVVADIESIVESRQRKAGVTESNLITMLVSEESTGVDYVEGDATRASIALLAMGIGGGTAAAVLVDRRLSRRQK